MDKIFRNKNNGYKSVAYKSIVAVLVTQNQTAEGEDPAETRHDVQILTEGHEIDMQLTVAQHDVLVSEWNKAL